MIKYLHCCFWTSVRSSTRPHRNSFVIISRPTAKHCNSNGWEGAAIATNRRLRRTTCPFLAEQNLIDISSACWAPLITSGSTSCAYSHRLSFICSSWTKTNRESIESVEKEERDWTWWWSPFGRPLIRFWAELGPFGVCPFMTLETIFLLHGQTKWKNLIINKNEMNVMSD